MRIVIRHSYVPRIEEFDLSVFIDVFRATTTLLYITNSKAAQVINTSDGETVKKLMGEGCELISEILKGGADNSPLYISKTDLSGKKLIHKTGNFSNSLAFNKGFKKALACGFVNVKATADFIRAGGFNNIEIITSDNFPAKTPAIEDFSCALYLKSLLLGKTPDKIEYLPSIREKAARRVSSGYFGKDYLTDTAMALTLNVFDYAVEIISCENNCFRFQKSGAA